jgi:diacylglycerol O-acyltransferase / wax synthase
MSNGALPVSQPGRLDRLSALDVSNLRVEDHGMPMHVAALAIVTGAPLVDASGRLRLDEIRADVEQRLCLAPRLRQVLCRARPGLGSPVWADDAGFDIRQHVRVCAVPAPGDEAALLELCSELNRPPLDRSRPLWEVWLLPGLADGNVGMLIRLHHAIADGIAALAMIGALLGTSPNASPPAVPAWQAAPAPSSRRLFADTMRLRAAGLTATLSGLRHPARLTHRVGSVIHQVRQLAGEGLAPRVSWNRQAGTGRRLMLVRADLAGVKAVAHAHGATVNDVMLAAVAGGARRLLAERGELRPGLQPKASVAASTRDPGDLAGAGNQAGIMLVPLPVSEADPVRRLVEIGQATRERKRYPPYQPAGRFAQRWMVRSMSRQRLVNLFTSNLPGPAAPLYFAGARVLEIFQVGVVQGNVTVAVGMLSYAGQLGFSIVGDADAVPDLKIFADGLSDALSQLGAGGADAASLPPIPVRTSPTRRTPGT